MIETIGLVGAGTMGEPMGRNLLKAGFALRVYDLDTAAVKRLVEHGAIACQSPADTVHDAQAVITMLPDSPMVETALFGEDGIASALTAETLYIDMSTILPSQTDAFATKLREHGVTMLDAPVGRSSQHAVEGKLLIMVGGPQAAVEQARTALQHLGDTIVHCGEVGSGSRMKVVNNYMSIVLNVLTAETLTLAECSGLDPQQAREVMLATVAGQGHLGTTYPAKVLKGDLTPGFMVDLAHKDLGLGLAMAAELDAPAYLGAVARQAYSDARRQGRGRQDWTSLYEGMRAAAVRHDTAR